MAENESKYGKIAIVGGGRCSGKTAVIQLEIFEELQAYRSIGTVEQLNTLQQDYWKLNEICKEYSAIGTIEEFKALKAENAELHCEMQAIGATSDMFEKEIRNKAIDEFERKSYKWNHTSSKKVPYAFIKWVVEQMKEGAE